MFRIWLCFSGNECIMGSNLQSSIERHTLNSTSGNGDIFETGRSGASEKGRWGETKDRSMIHDSGYMMTKSISGYQAPVDKFGFCVERKAYSEIATPIRFTNPTGQAGQVLRHACRVKRLLVVDFTAFSVRI